jgi:hypothetical protein
MRTVATFESNEFNLTEHRDYFMNEGCYGDDLGKWLIDRLRAAGAETDSDPQQEDFGWYVNYSLDDQPFCAVIGNIGGESWFVVVERVTGFLGSVLGGRHRNVPDRGIEILHRIFSSSPELRNLQWHKWGAFRRGGPDAFSSGSSSPDAA